MQREDLETPFLEENLFAAGSHGKSQAHLQALEAETPLQHAFASAPAHRPLTEREVMLVAKSSGDLWGDKLGNIDVHAQRAIVRLSRNPATAADAHALLDAVKSRALRGIFIENQKVPALRAQKLGTSYWKLIPAGEDAALVPAPAPSQEPPLIAFRDSVKSLPPRLDVALVRMRRRLLPQTAGAEGTVRVVARPRSDTRLVAVDASGKLLVTLGEEQARRAGDFLVFDVPPTAATARLLIVSARGVLDLGSQHRGAVAGIAHEVGESAAQRLRIGWPKTATKALEREFFEGAAAAIEFDPAGGATVTRGGSIVGVPAEATRITLTVRVPKLQLTFRQTFLVERSSGSLRLTPFRTRQPNGTLPPWALHPRLALADTTLPERLPLVEIDTDIVDITARMLADPTNPTLKNARDAYSAEISRRTPARGGQLVLLQDTRAGGRTWGAYVSPAAWASPDPELALMFRHELPRRWDAARLQRTKLAPTGHRDIDYSDALMTYLSQTTVRPGSFIFRGPPPTFFEYHAFGWGEQLDRSTVPAVLLLPIPLGADFGSLESGAESGWNTLVKVYVALLGEQRLGSANQLSPPEAPSRASIAGFSSGTDTVHRWMAQAPSRRSAIQHVDRVILFDGKVQTIPQSAHQRWFRASPDRKLVLVTGIESKVTYPALARSVATADRRPTLLIPDEDYWDTDRTYAQAFAPTCWVDAAGRPREFRLDSRPSQPPPVVPNAWTVATCAASGTVSQALNLYTERRARGGTIVASAFIGGRPHKRAMALSSCELAGYAAYFFRAGGRVSSGLDFARLQAESARYAAFPSGEREPIRRCRHMWTVFGGTRSDAGVFEGFLAQALRT